MLELRRSLDRGYTQLGALKSYHTFSFADYYDPVFEDFSSLRVINEDRLQPGKGYDSPAQVDFEVLTYMLSGELGHRDSLGNTTTLRPGDVQRWSSAAGVSRTQFNSSASREAHALQIWVKAGAAGLPPGFEQKSFASEDKRGKLRLIASTAGEAGSLRIRPDARLYAGLFNAAEQAEFEVERRAYVHVVAGSIAVNDTRLNAGDGVKITAPGRFACRSGRDAHVLLFDLP